MFKDLGSLCLYLSVAFTSYIFFAFAKQERARRPKSPLVFVGFFVAIVIPSIFAGLRYNVGTDYANYDYKMTRVRDMTLVEIFQLENIELGYSLLIKFLTSFFSNPMTFGIISAITLAIVAYALATQYEDLDYSMMYFVYVFQYYFFSYNLMRQNIAMAIVFFTMKYIYEGKFRNFIIGILIAMSFHYSALLFVPAYFLWNKPKKIKLKMGGKLFLAAAVVLATINFRNILSFLVNLGVPFISKYMYLMINSETAQNRDIIIKIIILVILWMFKKRLVRDNEKYGFLVDLYAINVVISFTGFYTPFFKRIAYYYAMPEMILMTRISKIAATPIQRYVLRWVIMLCYMCLFILVAYILGQSQLIPYRTIFQ